MSNNIQKKNTNKNLKKKRGMPNIMNSNIITTPCEKVLSILKQVKSFLISFAKDQVKLIQNLDWCIKVITSRSLYSYEIKENEAINKLSEDNPEFKQLVDFVSEYNEQVMNGKFNNILGDNLLKKLSFKLNKRKIERKNSFEETDSQFEKVLDIDKLIENQLNKENTTNQGKIYERRKTTAKPRFHAHTINRIEDSNDNKIKSNNTNNNININDIKNSINKIIATNDTNGSINNKSCKINICHNPFEENIIKSRILLKKHKKQHIKIIDDKAINKTSINNKKVNDLFENIPSSNQNYLNYVSNKCRKTANNSRKKEKKNDSKFLVSYDENYVNKKEKNIFPSIQKISITISNDNNDVKGIKSSYKKAKTLGNNFNSINSLNISLTNKIVCSEHNKDHNVPKLISKSRKNVPNIKGYSYLKINNKLIHEGYDISKLITDKNFEIFKLKELIGYNNVLPMVGRVILENLGLLDEEILDISKLDKFLTAVSNQYKPQSLYHNAIHGADVTQSSYIFFTHSNAEKLAKTNVIDLLSIIIAALGHDIGHPGLTNAFHINDSTEIAITYNDISVLENFHASTLFKTIRKTENNIFSKLTSIDYKIIRKRMILEILATDMANHGKVISLIKSKITLNENNEYKLKLLSGNEETQNEEQQSLLDFMLHLADLAHNTKIFKISKQWVELLTEEFWKQGDIEKEHNLPVSFLCDREKVNIPQSQKGFISGIIIPTFEIMATIFPTLKFTLENANNNLKEWQKLMEQDSNKECSIKKDDTDEKKNNKLSLFKLNKPKKDKVRHFSAHNQTKKENEKNENNNNEKNKNENITKKNSIKNKNDPVASKIEEDTMFNKNRNNNEKEKLNRSCCNKFKNMIEPYKNKKNTSNSNNHSLINTNVNNSNNSLNNYSEIPKKINPKTSKFQLKKNNKIQKSIKIKINLRENLKENIMEKEDSKNIIKNV